MNSERFAAARMEIKLIDLPKITDPRGNLTFAEAQAMVPFDIKRAYWVYDVPGGESRGGHAHKRLKQFVVALSGSFHVTLDNGRERKTVLLNHPWQGLLIDTNTWRLVPSVSCWLRSITRRTIISTTTPSSLTTSIK